MVTNNRCVAEQNKSDNVEKIATGCVKNEEFGSVGKSENSKNVVMGERTLENFAEVGKSEHSDTDEDKKVGEEEKLCMSIIKGFRRHNCERHAILAAVGEEDQRVSCILIMSQAKNCRGLTRIDFFA